MLKFIDHSPKVRRLIRRIENINLMSSNHRLDKLTMIGRAAAKHHMDTDVITFNLRDPLTVGSLQNKEELVSLGLPLNVYTQIQLDLINILLKPRDSYDNNTKESVDKEIWDLYTFGSSVVITSDWFEKNVLYL